MKHLLLILSIPLLSSPLIGDNHKGETLYRWDTSSGYVWKEFGEKDTNPKYKGDVENGKPNGFGFLIFTNGDKYVGEWKNGKKQGQGTFTYGKGKWEGEKYEGEFEDGIKHGQGTWTSIKGYKFVGGWRENKSWNGKEYDKKGNIIGKYVNGEIQ